MPRAVAAEANNKFGIHIVDENDLPEAAALVNSGGGEWGYVTLVVREDERDVARWQRAFDQMRRLKLIPIVRLATKMANSHWEIPKEEEAVNWAGFLNSLNWPVKTRYIVLFNEPNHAKEWGGTIDPSGFAKISRHYYQTLKSFSEDFIIMAGGLDLAATNSHSTMEAGRFFGRMHSADNYIFTLFDALASHSYPNPGFSGHVNDSGKTSIKGYKWELTYLSNYGMRADIPVFITETGWLNDNADSIDHYKTAFENVWSDPQIIAVTPFLLSYLNEPFKIFSWKNPETGQFLPQYYSVQSLTKIKGLPEQKHALEFISHDIADYLVSDSEYSFPITIKNTGQSIWDSREGFKLVANSSMNSQNIRLENLSGIEPGHTAKVNIRLATNEPRGIHSVDVAFYKDGLKITDVFSTQFTLVSPPSVNILANFFPSNDARDVTLSVYDQGLLITRFEHLSLAGGTASIKSMKGVIPNRTYKFTLSKPFWSSSSKEAKLLVGATKIDFGTILPVPYFLSWVINPLTPLIHLLP